jgi:hypothetical protein
MSIATVMCRCDSFMAFIVMGYGIALAPSNNNAPVIGFQALAKLNFGDLYSAIRRTPGLFPPRVQREQGDFVTPPAATAAQRHARMS